MYCLSLGISVVRNPDPLTFFHQIIIFREKATSALAGFQVGPLSWSN